MKQKSSLFPISLLLLLFSLHSQADIALDIRVEAGISDYEIGNYLGAMDNWTAALIRGMQTNENVMKPSVYLCSMWYHGSGVKKDLDRAKEACDLVVGKKGKFEAELFQGVLESNGTPGSGFEFRKALSDAAVALRWYIDTYMD